MDDSVSEGTAVFRRWTISAIAAATLLAPLGCKHHCRKGDCGPSTNGGDSMPPTSTRDPNVLRDPVYPPGVIPPRDPALPTTPGSGFDPTVPLSPPNRTRDFYSPQDSPPPPIPKTESSKPPASVPTEPLPPYKSNKELLLPEPISPDSKSQSNYSSILLPPIPSAIAGILQEPIHAVTPRDLPEGASVAPAPVPERAIAPPPMVMPGPDKDLPPSVPDSSAKPAGVFEYEKVPGFENVASGRKPLPEGLAKLKEKGFRTVAYLHAPGVDVTATKELVEKNGMKFVSIPVSAAKLKENSATFAEQIKDADARPLFIADDDGVRAGSLWYVYFRSVDLLDADQARVRANRLGLQDGQGNESQKQFWIAINELLKR